MGKICTWFKNPDTVRRYGGKPALLFHTHCSPMPVREACHRLPPAAGRLPVLHSATDTRPTLFYTACVCVCVWQGAAPIGAQGPLTQ